MLQALQQKRMLFGIVFVSPSAIGFKAFQTLFYNHHIGYDQLLVQCFKICTWTGWFATEKPKISYHMDQGLAVADLSPNTLLLDFLAQLDTK